VRRADRDAVERLAKLVSDATVGAYVELFPYHDGARELLAAHPELKAQGRRYYQSIARHLLAAGVQVSASPAPVSNKKQTRTAKPDDGSDDSGLFT
jgi:hypothetical protein